MVTVLEYFLGIEELKPPVCDIIQEVSDRVCMAQSLSDHVLAVALTSGNLAQADPLAVSSINTML